MPIYEFLCPSCNRIFSFHSFRHQPDKVPTCPKCGATDLRWVPSSFGITSGSSGGDETAGDGGGSDRDDPRMEREMMRLMSEMEGIDEDDPRQMGRAVRRMAEIAGEPITPAMEEMIRRMEAGEDPEQIEEELGDELEAEMGGGDGVAAAPIRDGGLYPM